MSISGLEEMPEYIPESVKILDLTYNYIEDINASTMNRLSKLETFWFLPSYLPQTWKAVKNHSQIMDNGLFAGNPHLKDLMFETSRYRLMPANFIIASNLTKLRVYRGSYVPIVNFFSTVVHLSPDLQELELWVGDKQALENSNFTNIKPSWQSKCNLRKITVTLYYYEEFLQNVSSGMFQNCPLHTLDITLALPQYLTALPFRPSFFDNLPTTLNFTLRYKYDADDTMLRSLITSLGQSNIAEVNFSIPEPGAPVNVVLGLMQEYNVTSKITGLTLDMQNCNDTCLYRSAQFLHDSFLKLQTIFLSGFKDLTIVDIQEWFSNPVRLVNLKSLKSDEVITFIFPDGEKTIQSLSILHIDGPEWYCSCKHNHRGLQCIQSGSCYKSLITFSSCPNLTQLTVTFRPLNKALGTTDHAGIGQFKFTYSFSSLQYLTILKLEGYHLCSEGTIYAQHIIESPSLTQLYFVNGTMCLDKATSHIPVACPNLKKLSLVNSKIRSIAGKSTRKRILKLFFKKHSLLTDLDMTGVLFSAKDTSEGITLHDMKAIGSLTQLRRLKLRNAGVEIIPEEFTTVPLEVDKSKAMHLLFMLCNLRKR